MTDGGRQHMQMPSVHRPNKTKPVEPTSRLWAHVGGVDIPLQREDWAEVEGRGGGDGGREGGQGATA